MAEFPPVSVVGVVNIDGLDTASAIENSQYAEFEAEAIRRGAAVLQDRTLDEVADLYPGLTLVAAFARITQALDFAEVHRSQLGLHATKALDFRTIGAMDAETPLHTRIYGNENAVTTTTTTTDESAPALMSAPTPKVEDEEPAPDPAEVAALAEAIANSSPAPKAHFIIPPSGSNPVSARATQRNVRQSAPPTPSLPFTLTQDQIDGLILGVAFGVGATLLFFYFRPSPASVVEVVAEVAA